MLRFPPGAAIDGGGPQQLLVELLRLEARFGGPFLWGGCVYLIVYHQLDYDS